MNEDEIQDALEILLRAGLIEYDGAMATYKATEKAMDLSEEENENKRLLDEVCGSGWRQRRLSFDEPEEELEKERKPEWHQAKLEA